MAKCFYLIIFCLFLGPSFGWAGAEDYLARKAIADFERAQKSQTPCTRAKDCMPFLNKLMDEDARPMSLGIVTSNVLRCQAPLNQNKSNGRGQNANYKLRDRFSNAEDMQNHFAKMFPEIGSVNHQKISACNDNEDTSARYKIAKFYHYNKRFNQGATRAFDELAAINSLLGQNDPLPCDGRGTIEQAFRRCEELSKSCRAGSSQLDAVAAASEQDEKDYLAAKGQIEQLHKTCLLGSADYETHGKNLTAANPEKTHCVDVFVERQATKKHCTVYTLQKKQQIAQCQTFKDNLTMVMSSLEEKNPWFKGSLYFKSRKDKSIKESIQIQVLSNRHELKKKVREFRNASLCVNGFMSESDCSTKDVRKLLNETPEIPEFQNQTNKDKAAYAYLEAQACTEEDYSQRKQKSEMINGLALDATLLIATAGMSGIATSAKVAMTVRGAAIARSAYLGTLAVSAFYASRSYKDAINTCSPQLLKVEASAKAGGPQCPGPQSNLSQTQKDYSSCMVSAGFAALDTLPLAVPFASSAIKSMNRGQASARAQTQTVARASEAAAVPPASAQRVNSPAANAGVASKTEDIVVDDWNRASGVRQKVDYETAPVGEGSARVVRQAPIRTELFSKRTGHALENRDSVIAPYGSRAEHLDELKKYQAAIASSTKGQGRIQHATMIIDGKFDHNILSFMAKEAPDVSLVETIRLPSGKKYAVALRKGNNADLKLNNPELSSLSAADREAVAAIEHSIQTGGYNSVDVSLEGIRSAQQRASQISSASQKRAVTQALKNDERIANIDAELDHLLAKKTLSSAELSQVSRIQKEKHELVEEQLKVLAQADTKNLYHEISSESFNQARISHMKGEGYLSPGHRNKEITPQAFEQALEQVGAVQNSQGVRAQQIASSAQERRNYVTRAFNEAQERRSVNDLAAKNELSVPNSDEYRARQRRRELGFINPEGDNVSDVIPMDNAHVMLDVIAGRNPEQYVRNGVISKADGDTVFDAAELKSRLQRKDGFIETNPKILIDPTKKAEGLSVSPRFSEAKLGANKTNLDDVNIERLESMARNYSATNRSKNNILSRAKYKRINNQLANLSAKNKNYGIEYEKINRDLKKLRERANGNPNAEIKQSIQTLEDRKNIIATEKANIQESVAAVKREKVEYLSSEIGPSAKLQMITEEKVHEGVATKLIYHVDTQNQVRLYEEGLSAGATRPAHSQLAGRRDPVIAGELYLRKNNSGAWEIAEINDGSGHYRPNARNLEFVKKLLEQDYGIDIPKDVKLVHGTSREMNSGSLRSSGSSNSP